MTPEQHAELNAWVAENVMGFKMVKSFGENSCKIDFRNGALTTPDGKTLAGWWREDGSFIWRAWYKGSDYTTSPADAFSVLEKMLQVYGEFELLRYDSGLYHLTHHSINIDTTAPTLPLAIVLTAKQLFGKADQ